MRRLFIEIPEQTFRTLAERALDERRGVREQAGYELERLFPPADQRREHDERQPAESEPA